MGRNSRFREGSYWPQGDRSLNSYCGLRLEAESTVPANSVVESNKATGKQSLPVAHT